MSNSPPRSQSLWSNSNRDSESGDPNGRSDSRETLNHQTSEGPAGAHHSGGSSLIPSSNSSQSPPEESCNIARQIFYLDAITVQTVFTDNVEEGKQGHNTATVVEASLNS
ncbi:hypothetical protein ABW19_dt0200192 [Dactylella cylindrospora]|nr:hypothetical protein ABW19_dt0200192 [Dactylella cylindrospora]